MTTFLNLDQRETPEEDALSVNHSHTALQILKYN